MRGEVFFELPVQGTAPAGGGQFVDDVDGVGKEDRMTRLCGGKAQGGGQVGLTQPDGAQEDHVGMALQELQAEEVLDLETIDLLGPVELELFEGFDDREAGGLNAPLDQALMALVVFALHQTTQILDMIPLVFGGLLGHQGMVGLDEG